MSFPRLCEDSSHPQLDKRTSTTTLAAASRTITNLQRRESNDNGVLQSNTSIQQERTGGGLILVKQGTSKLKQQTSPSVSANHGGGIAPMNISAIEGKGKGYKGKGKN